MGPSKLEHGIWNVVAEMSITDAFFLKEQACGMGSGNEEVRQKGRSVGEREREKRTEYIVREKGRAGGEYTEKQKE